ncbi:iron sulfur assembly protein 1 [Pseudohyphozyma bogoriensis]|nr:iron sulfur assembly protein 1 [Pseudohyphozyma bogoriensis]
MPTGASIPPRLLGAGGVVLLGVGALYALKGEDNHARAHSTSTPASHNATAVPANTHTTGKEGGGPGSRNEASYNRVTSPSAVTHLQTLLSSPTPQLIRVGVRNKGCAGMSYHLEYVDKPEKFDEVVEQDGVKVVIDSKALFSIIGSRMEWRESELGSKFVFENPNIKDACGCGESFIV